MDVLEIGFELPTVYDHSARLASGNVGERWCAAAPLLYADADVLAGVRWEGYRFRDQTVTRSPPRGH